MRSLARLKVGYWQKRLGDFDGKNILVASSGCSCARALCNAIVRELARFDCSITILTLRPGMGVDLLGKFDIVIYPQIDDVRMLGRLAMLVKDGGALAFGASNHTPIAVASSALANYSERALRPRRLERMVAYIGLGRLDSRGIVYFGNRKGRHKFALTHWRPWLYIGCAFKDRKKTERAHDRSTIIGDNNLCGIINSAFGHSAG